MGQTGKKQGELADDTSSEQIKRIVANAVVYAMSKGIVMMAPDGTGVSKVGDPWLPTRVAGHTVIHAPFALFPSPLPRGLFKFGNDLTPIFNTLVHKIAADHDFLLETLAHTAEADDFTGNLVEIFRRTVVEREPGQRAPPAELGVHRFDYFATEESKTEPANLLQVELNTIAASFGALSTRISGLHTYTTLLHSASVYELELPHNSVTNSVCEALATTHRLFRKAYPSLSDAEVKVVMVVQPDERNVFDQEAFSQTLMEVHRIAIVRMSLEQIAERCSVADDGTLVAAADAGEDRFVASVVYFRAGYTPNDYPTDDCWLAREVIERSAAIKCPSVAYQLVGTKKVQQVLDAPNGVERFLGAKDGAFARQCFASQWSLEGEGAEEAVAMALEQPDDFVLKPQREGGGNNFFGASLVKELKRMSEAERAAYILMQRIQPAVHRNILVRNGEYLAGETVFELGMFGVWVSEGEHVVLNRKAGHLMRTKLADVDEGGVAAGVAVLDSPALV